MKSFIGLAVTMLASASMSWAQDVEKETDLQEVETKDWSSHEELYANLAVTEGIGVASDCIECGMCEDRCPQHLEIREYLKAVAEHFEK